MNILGKMQAKGIVGPVHKLITDQDEGTRIDLFKVAGIAREMKKGESTFGEYTGFKGDFQAVTPEGEKFRSGECYLPNAATAIVENGLLAETGDVQFCFDIGIQVITDDKGNPDYVYTVGIDQEPQESDPVAALLEAPAKKKK